MHQGPEIDDPKLESLNQKIHAYDDCPAVGHRTRTRKPRIRLVTCF